MKKCIKKIAAAILAASMMFSGTFANLDFTSVPESIFAETVSNDGYTIEYIQNDKNSVCIQNVIPSDTPSETITIPEKIDGKSVVCIMFKCFSQCQNAETIILPDGLEQIESFAFSDCIALKEITIPDSVYSVGKKAFSGCSSLVNVKLSEKTTVISSGLFYKCTSLSSVTIPENTEIIEDKAFENTNITHITIPDSVEIIYDYAFFNMPELEKITLSPYLHRIYDTSFSNSVIIDYSIKNVKTVNGVIFSDDMTKLINYPLNAAIDMNSEYEVPSTVTEICDDAFSLTGLEKITLSKNTKKIGNNVFNSCSILKYIDYNGSSPVLGKYVFSYCRSLRYMILPPEIETIPEGTFSGCSKILTARIPDGVKNICERSMPQALLDIYIPASVEFIDDNAFATRPFICAESGTEAERYALSNHMTFISDTVSEPLYADVNRDGIINILDIIELKRLLLEDENVRIHEYDVNGDEILMGSDLTDMLLYFYGNRQKKGFGDIRIIISYTDTGLKTDNYNEVMYTSNFITTVNELEEYFEKICINTSDVNSYVDKYQNYLNDYVISITNDSLDSSQVVSGSYPYTMLYYGEYEISKSSKDSFDKPTMYVVLMPRTLYMGQKIKYYNSTISDIAYKPVIYLYPEEETEINVKLITDRTAKLTSTYPKYPEDEGWTVTAEPDSTLYDKNGREYSYLFWEADTYREWDMSEGFVVKGEDTVDFLQEKLEYLGLTPKEYNDFIVFWLPKMEKNKYNLITFQTDAYEEMAKLEITPKPDSIQRVFMTYKALDKYEEVPEQKLTPFKRYGYSVIEWGGSEITH